MRKCLNVLTFTKHCEQMIFVKFSNIMPQNTVEAKIEALVLQNTLLWCFPLWNSFRRLEICRMFSYFCFNLYMSKKCNLHIHCVLYMLHYLLYVPYIIFSMMLLPLLSVLALVLYHIQSCRNDPVSIQRSLKFHMKPGNEELKYNHTFFLSFNSASSRSRIKHHKMNR